MFLLWKWHQQFRIWRPQLWPLVHWLTQSQCSIPGHMGSCIRHWLIIGGLTHINTYGLLAMQCIFLVVEWGEDRVRPDSHLQIFMSGDWSTSSIHHYSVVEDVYRAFDLFEVDWNVIRESWCRALQQSTAIWFACLHMNISYDVICNAVK